ncbi:MAG: nuclear transport factor 2 family protein, partial [Anaerolineales bacterium]
MNNKELIQSYFETFFQGPAKHSQVREWLTQDFTFRDPLMSADSADEYVDQLTAMGDEMALYADVKQLVSEGDVVAAMVDFRSPAGVVPYAQWFTLREGKIARLEVVYDPRP